LNSHSEEINNNKGRHGAQDNLSSPEEMESNPTLFDVKQTQESNHTISSTSQMSSPESMTTHEELSPTTTNTTTNDEGIDNSSVISGDGYQSDNWSISSLKNQRYLSFFSPYFETQLFQKFSKHQISRIAQKIFIKTFTKI